MQGHAAVQLPAEAHAEDHALPSAHQKCESSGGWTQNKGPPAWPEPDTQGAVVPLPLPQAPVCVG